MLKKKYDSNGNEISPILEGDSWNYLIDIDGTITEDIPNEEPDRMKTCDPYPEAKEIINQWYDEGNTITFFTSRTEELREITEKWLDDNGFKYHGIVMGKPRGGKYIFIDNHIVKSVRYKGVWNNLVPVDKTVYIFPEDD